MSGAGLDRARPDIAWGDPFAGPPRLNGARRVGIRPGTELIHALASTGARPLTWTVRGLPEGVTVDDDGIVHGRAPSVAGEHSIDVEVTNALGTATDRVVLCVGDRLALTPPMGWNSWNVYADAIDAATVVRTARAIVDLGLRDLGYQYVNIDDHWHATARGTGGVPLADPETFPEGIAAVADEVHDLGLKLGIYSDAAEKTCGNCFGGLDHEEIDATAYARWGIDYLKYDYCHAPRDAATAARRYGKMGRALADSGRSIVFSTCEWGRRRPWEWAPGTGSSLWRTTWDIFDTFDGMLGVRGIARRNLALGDHAGPGRWNDPDMLVIGNHGRGRATGALRAPLRGDRRPKLWSFRGLTDIEAHTHMTLWSMMAAPLLASHDLAASDPYDLALLTNPEVLAIDQDPLGIQARVVEASRGHWVLRKPLADGSVAVSLTNLARRPRTLAVALDALDVAGADEIVDAWTHEVGVAGPSITARLPSHGSTLVVIRPAADRSPPGGSRWLRPGGSAPR